LEVRVIPGTLPEKGRRTERTRRIANIVSSIAMKRFLPHVVALVGAFLAMGPLDAASALFIKLSDVKTGESTDKFFPGSEGWNELAECSWSIEAETSWTKGGGASVGKPSPGKFEIRRSIDSSSATVIKNMTSGRASPTVEIALRQEGRGENASDQTVLHYTFEDVYFVNFSQATSEEGEVTELISFVYRTIKVGYRPTDPKTGKPGGEVTVEWNVPAGQVSGP